MPSGAGEGTLAAVAEPAHAVLEGPPTRLGVEAFELELELPPAAGHRSLLESLRERVREQLDEELLPIRLAVTRTGDEGYACELGVVSGLTEEARGAAASIFDFRRRASENASAFTTVFVVPTGIGSTQGGHAGDSTPAAQLLASVSDTLVTHPNVVNASDVNELPANGLYVEGSVLARFLMGTIGLAPVRSNRVLAVADAHPDRLFLAHAVNSVSAARASFGLSCPGVLPIDPPLPAESHYARSGRAVGSVAGLERLFSLLDDHRGEYDAVALTTQIKLDPQLRTDYYGSRGEIVNPWGGVEAILTHAVSTLFDVPAAHSPMLESREIASLELGIVDPRIAAEAISVAYFICVLKGLQRSPRIVPVGSERPGVLRVEDVSCLVVPDKAVGLPTLAALEQGIPVVAVRENENLMENDLEALPWPPGRLHVVDNYWEAAGVVACLRAGVDPASVRRPLADTVVE
jgi:Protein of unknown function (DUF3326)